MSQEAIDRLKERDAVQEYLETGTTGDIYMDGSAFEDKSIRKDKETNKRFRQSGLMREQQDLKTKQNMPEISTELIIKTEDATSDLNKPYLKDKISELWKTSNN